jgi:glycosyltransferase involved in cell wall biosynthesis
MNERSTSRRLVCIHYTAPPQVGGVEWATHSLAAVAARTPAWQGAVISGTPASAQEGDASQPQLFYIPELSTTDSRVQEIFRAYRSGRTQHLIKTVADSIYVSLNDLLRPKDLVVCLNCHFMPLNIALTSVLWKLSENRADISFVAWAHDSWTGDFHHQERPMEYPWTLLQKSCPNVIYMATTRPLALTLANLLGIPPHVIRVVPNGIDPMRCLRLTGRVAGLFDKHRLLGKCPIVLTTPKVCILLKS